MLKYIAILLPYSIQLGMRQNGAKPHAAYLFWIVFAIGVILLLGGLYLAYIYIEAKLEVQAAPREPMFECPKHGVFRRKHLQKIDMFGPNEDPYEICPLCFDERLQVGLDSSVIPKGILSK